MSRQAKIISRLTLSCHHLIWSGFTDCQTAAHAQKIPSSSNIISHLNLIWSVVSRNLSSSHHSLAGIPHDAAHYRFIAPHLQWIAKFQLEFQTYCLHNWVNPSHSHIAVKSATWAKLFPNCNPPSRLTAVPIWRIAGLPHFCQILLSCESRHLISALISRM